MQTSEINRQIATLNQRRTEARAKGEWDTAYRISKKIVVLVCQRDMAKRATK